MSRRYDPTKARRHWYYTRKQLCELFDVCDTTITNWKRAGLEAIDEGRPDVFHGSAVELIHARLRWGDRRDPKDGKLFCCSCRRFMPLVDGRIDLRLNELRQNRLSGHCIKCDRSLWTYASASQVNDIYRAAASTTGDSSADRSGRIPGSFAESGHSVAAETNNTNMRWLSRYQLYLTENAGLADPTVDENLRSLARTSAILSNKSFADYAIADAMVIKDALREALDDEPSPLSLPTVDRNLGHCRRFFTWLGRQDGVTLEPDLPGYFRLKLRERRLLNHAAKETDFSIAQALSLFRLMPDTDPIDFRNKAMIALLIMTGIRVDALASLRGKHVDVRSYWINQAPPGARTKHDKPVRSYCLDLGCGMREALRRWADWRERSGFGRDDAFFLPYRFIGPNQIGLGHRPAQADQSAAPWRQSDSVRAIVKCAAQAAGLADLDVGPHDLRRMIHPYLASNADMSERHKIALQLNLGHTPRETIHKHYTSMTDTQRQDVLDELCRMIRGRSDPDLVLAFERDLIPESDPDYERARRVHAKATSAAQRIKD